MIALTPEILEMYYTDPHEAIQLCRLYSQDPHLPEDHIKEVIEGVAKSLGEE